MPAFSRFLGYFMAVGRHGSIRRAAEELNISASAIDRQILNAEAELGVQLFERFPTGLKLTAAGEILMASGMQWNTDLADLRARIDDLQGLKRGHVEIAVIDAMAKGYLPRRIRTIQQDHPGISFNIRVLDNDDVRAAILDGEVDFGILFEPESFRDLRVRAFCEVVLGFLTPPDHPFAKEEKQRFSMCVGEPLILPSPPLQVYHQVAVLEGVTGVTLDRRATSDNVQMIISLVLQGLGLGVLSSLDAITEVEQGLIRFVPISDPILRPMTLALCTKSSRTPSHAAAMVLRELESTIAELGHDATRRRD